MGGLLVVLPVSGFLPVPLPMMIPFMGAQSLVIGKMFGEGFQYGKRKISAMSNDEFNKLTFEDMMSNARTELKASIPTINASLQDMDEMVEVVVNEFLKYIGLVTKTVIETTGEKAFQIADTAAHAAGTHLPFGHEVAEAPPPVDSEPITPGGVLRSPPVEFPKSKIILKQPVIPNVKFKRKAGQTQILERKKLIKQIAVAGQLLKAGLSSPYITKNSLRLRKQSLLRFQQQLVELLARFSF